MSIEAIDLNLLQTFHLVVGERSVVRAARRLHVTPSAVSNALARLRDLLGDPIVTRQGRGLVPTPRAAELAPIVARALGELSTALFAAPFDPATCARRFTLAIADPGQLSYVPRIARQLALELPAAELRVVGIDALVSLGDLGSSEIDVHIGVRGSGPGLHAEPLIDEPSVLVARRGRKRVRLAEVRHVRVDMTPGRGLRDPAGEAYRRAKVHREVAITVPTFTAAAAVVAATDHVATVPASFARAFGNALGVEIVRGAPSYRVQLVLSWHDRTHGDPASIAFRAAIRRAIG